MTSGDKYGSIFAYFHVPGTQNNDYFSIKFNIMKLKFIPFLCLLATTAFILPSCDKDDDDPGQTRTELITQGTWRLNSATIAGIEIAEDCQLDNTLVFTSAGSGTANEGATKCDPADPQSENFTWSFANNETQLVVSGTIFTGGNGTVTIVTLNSTQLVVSQVVDVLGSPQTAQLTFVH
jgi:hypothetical protein